MHLQSPYEPALHKMDNGIWVPIDFFCKKLIELQCRYSAFDSELLSVCLFVLRCKPFLEGGDVILCTDHKPFVVAFYKRTPVKIDRQQRHASIMLKHTSSVECLKGSDNVIGDALS